MDKPKITYFDFNGGRGEEIRLALHIAGVDFTDNRVKHPDWPALKPNTPFGALPVFETDEGILSQSNAILGLIGARHGLLPANDFAAAHHVSLMNAVEDLQARVGPTYAMEEEQKKKVRTELVAGYLKDWAANMEKQIAGPFVSDELSVADIKLYVLVKGMKSGMLDYFPQDFFDNYHKITGVYNAVGAHPKVVEWNDAHSGK